MPRFDPKNNAFDRWFPNSIGASARRAKDEADARRAKK